MQVITLINGEQKGYEVAANDIRSILSLLKLQLSPVEVSAIANSKFKYILTKKADPEAAIAVIPEMVLASFDTFDTLIILEDIEGALFAPALFMGIAGSFASGVVATAAATLMAGLANMAVSMVVGMLVQALSPTNEFAGDPSSSQKTSNLFNGSNVTTEAGGSVPYLFGECYGSGVLISAGISTEDE